MANTLTERLLPWRNRIDELDRQILELLNERARAALEVGKIKQDFNTEEVILKPEREARIVRRLQSENIGPFTPAAVEVVWGQIISACRGLLQEQGVQRLITQQERYVHARTVRRMHGVRIELGRIQETV